MARVVGDPVTARRPATQRAARRRPRADRAREALVTDRPTSWLRSGTTAGPASARARGDRCAASRSARPARGSCDTTNPSPDICADSPALTSFRIASRALMPRTSGTVPAGASTSTLTIGDSCGTIGLRGVLRHGAPRAQAAPDRSSAPTPSSAACFGNASEDRRRRLARRSARSTRAASRASRDRDLRIARRQEADERRVRVCSSSGR